MTFAPLKPNTRATLRRTTGLLSTIHDELAAAGRADPENQQLAGLGMGVEDMMVQIRHALEAPDGE